MKIKHVKNKGELDKERIVLETDEDVNIGEYILASSVYIGDNSIAGNIKLINWLPDNNVNAGDLVVVYTKSGTDKKRENSNGTTTYFIYWGMSKPIWEVVGAAVVLFHIDEWSFERIADIG